MFKKDDEKDARHTIGHFEIAAQLTTARQIKFTGAVYSDDTPTEVNKRLDAVQDVIDRQFVRADMFTKEAQLAAQYESLRQFSEQGTILAEKKDRLAKAGKSLATTEREKVDNFDANIRTVKGNIASLEAALKAGRMKLNGVHPPA